MVLARLRSALRQAWRSGEGAGPSTDHVDRCCSSTVLKFALMLAERRVADPCDPRTWGKAHLRDIDYPVAIRALHPARGGPSTRASSTTRGRLEQVSFGK